MAGEDQERFEDYLELERYIDDLQVGLPAHPPADLTASQVRLYRTVALFRSASSDAAEPRPEFVQALHEQLLALDQEQDEEDTLELPASRKVATPKEAPQDQPRKQPVPLRSAMQGKREVKKMHFVSRRSLLAGSAAAAASLATGVSLGAALQQSQPSQVTSVPAQHFYGDVPLVPDTVPSTWHFVTTLAELGTSAMKFSIDTLVGYVILNDSDGNRDDPDRDDSDSVIAMSAACTHMGCIVQWSDSDRLFHCPCHGGIFTRYGNPATAGHLRYLTSLPRLNTKVVNGEVYVQVPMSNDTNSIDRKSV